MPGNAIPGTVTIRSGNFVNMRPLDHRAAPDQRSLRDVPFRPYPPPASPGAESPILPPSPTPTTWEAATTLMSMGASLHSPSRPPSSAGYEGGPSRLTSPGSCGRSRAPSPETSSAGSESLPSLTPASSRSSSPEAYSVYTPEQASIYGFSVQGSARNTPLDSRFATPELGPFAGTFPGVFPSPTPPPRPDTPHPGLHASRPPSPYPFFTAPTPGAYVDEGSTPLAYQSPTPRPSPPPLSRAPTPGYFDAPTPGAPYSPTPPQ